MQAEEIAYGEYQKHSDPRQRLIRAFGPWEILASDMDGRWLLMLVNPVTREDVVICDYDTWSERQQDIWGLRRHRSGDDFGGIAARITPGPPPTPDADAAALPRSGTEWGK